MGPTRLRLSKPVIAAISGYAVAGGLELACFCDLRVADESAVLGVFCRRFGVPLIDGGTVRLPQLIGLGRALDLILTGRPVAASEALAMGLVNRVVPTGKARQSAEQLAMELARLPQSCLRSDRMATLLQVDEPMPLDEALRREFTLGMQTILSGETVGGATAFASGEGRHGSSR
jgi:enoyl-CoA hydratase